MMDYSSLIDASIAFLGAGAILMAVLHGLAKWQAVPGEHESETKAATDADSTAA